MQLSETAQRAVEAYGGAERWAGAQTATGKGTVTGFLFQVWKSHMPQPNMSLECRIHEPWTRLDPIDSAGRVGVLDGTGVRLEDARGNVLEERPEARSHFPAGRRLIHWDALDLTYFLGYAVWNYFSLPALLMRDDIAWTETEPGALASVFPPHLPTHGVHQCHFFDEKTGLLRRYDYDPEILWPKPQAAAANVVMERGEYEGIPYESRRLVFPRHPRHRALGSEKVLPHPVMVNIHFWDWELH